MMSSDS